jgi:hypothetical protein
VDVLVPKIELWKEHSRPVVVLPCTCGYAMPYPGITGTPDAVLCERCGTTWRIAPPAALREVFESGGGGR